MQLLNNSYVSMQEFKDYFSDTGSTDVPDDRVITLTLNAVSRFFDGATRGRWFYPRRETRLFSLPNMEGSWRANRTLRMDADLLYVNTVLNGNGETILPDKFYLATPNSTPYWAVVLKETAGVIWQWSTTGTREYVVSVDGIWGTHDNYSNAYDTLSALSAGVDGATTALDVATGTGTLLSNGNILLIDDEWLACDAVTVDTATVRRGVNGSTATAHLAAAPIKVYRPMQDIVMACQMIALNAYRRFGNRSGATGDVSITGAGVVVTPKDVSGIAKSTIGLWTSRKLLIQY